MQKDIISDVGPVLPVIETGNVVFLPLVAHATQKGNHQGQHALLDIEVHWRGLGILVLNNIYIYSKH